jgi:hypothetical protein
VRATHRAPRRAPRTGWSAGGKPGGAIRPPAVPAQGSGGVAPPRAGPPGVHAGPETRPRVATVKALPRVPPCPAQDAPPRKTAVRGLGGAPCVGADWGAGVGLPPFPAAAE